MVNKSFKNYLQVFEMLLLYMKITEYLFFKKRFR